MGQAIRQLGRRGFRWALLPPAASKWERRKSYTGGKGRKKSGRKGEGGGGSSAAPPSDGPSLAPARTVAGGSDGHYYHLPPPNGREGKGEKWKERGERRREGGVRVTPPAQRCALATPPPTRASPQQGITQERDGRRTEEKGLMPHGHQAYPAQSLAPPPIWSVHQPVGKGDSDWSSAAESKRNAPRSNGTLPHPHPLPTSGIGGINGRRS